MNIKLNSNYLYFKLFNFYIFYYFEICPFYNSKYQFFTFLLNNKNPKKIKLSTFCPQNFYYNYHSIITKKEFINDQKSYLNSNNNSTTIYFKLFNFQISSFNYILDELLKLKSSISFQLKMFANDNDLKDDFIL